MQLALGRRSLRKEPSVYSRSKVESRALMLGLVSIISSGCAAGISSHPRGLGAGAWNVQLPATASYSQGLAYGRGGSSARAQSDADAPRLAEAHAAPLFSGETQKKPILRKRRLDQPPPTQNEPVAPAQEQTPVVPPPAQQERTELAFAAPPDVGHVGRYEAREAQSQSQQQFRGGDAIVIGASTLVIIILIVLLVLLLV
jgi:hypothetical protein